MKLPRVILADDHTLFAEAFRALLQPSCDVVATVSDGRALVRTALSLAPDLVLVDLAMPVLNGLEAMRRFRLKNRVIKTIFLTMNGNPDIAAEALQAGAFGFLLKTSAASELLQAIPKVLKGERYITLSVAQAMEEAFIRNATPRQSTRTPTSRQYEVIQLLAEGKAMKEVAASLNITERTVAFHKYGVMRKLGLKTTADLIRYVVKNGIVSA
jgi:DNA-binding NarL/FixJ family response regulator